MRNLRLRDNSVTLAVAQLRRQTSGNGTGMPRVLYQAPAQVRFIARSPTGDRVAVAMDEDAVRVVRADGQPVSANALIGDGRP